MIASQYAIDYQVHSLRSHDGRASIMDQCRRAVELGLDEIGFSEHKDFNPDDPVVDHFEYDLYATEIAAARQKLAGTLTVRMGVEIDYQDWFEDEIGRFLKRHPFDFVIGSVHYIDRMTVMSPEYLSRRSMEQAYGDYFRGVLASVQSGLIDIVGHLEYAKRRGVPALGPFDPAPYREQVSEIYLEMIRRGIALEINSAGLRQGAGGPYPGREHIELYRSLGGRLLTFGSDAHHPNDLASDFPSVFQMAENAGFEQVTVWEKRVPRQTPLRVCLA